MPTSLANAVDYMGYMSGQIVGRIKKEQTVREIMDGMKKELLDVVEGWRPDLPPATARGSSR